MSLQVKEVVGIAQEINTRENTEKENIEEKKKTILRLEFERDSLIQTIEQLQASLEVARKNDQEDNEENANQIAAIQTALENAKGELNRVEGALEEVIQELQHNESILDQIILEKNQVLNDIQENASITSQNISIAGGMYGAYSGVGNNILSVLQSNWSSLSQAAIMLGGSVGALGGIGSNGYCGGGFSNSPINKFGAGVQLPMNISSQTASMGSVAINSSDSEPNHTFSGCQKDSVSNCPSSNGVASGSPKGADDKDLSTLPVHSVNDDGQAIYETGDGIRVTYMDSPSCSYSTSKKYTAGIVFEGKIAVSNGDRTKSTVEIKRKIHQYAQGIDLNYRRSDGLTNYKAMLKGKSPIIVIQTENGPVEASLDLHHLTQQETLRVPNSPYKQGTLVEMPDVLHQKYSKAIHMQYPHHKGIRRSFRWIKLFNHKYKRSQDDRQFEAFKKKYWKTRALLEYELSKNRNP